jgi:hypothetical protein
MGGMSLPYKNARILAVPEYQKERWPIAEPVIKPPAEYRNPFHNMASEQIEELARRIEQQVVERDCRLVAQSRHLVAYRPFYPEDSDSLKGTPSEKSTDGVTREINYALELGNAVYVFHPKCDWCAKQEESLFTSEMLWGRTRRFPKKSQLAVLPEDDFSGFEELLHNLQH